MELTIYSIGVLLLLVIGELIGYSFRSFNQKDILDIQTKDPTKYPKPPSVSKKAILIKKDKNVIYEQDELQIAIEQERTRIKHALHDDTVQRIIGIKLQIESLLLTSSDSIKSQGEIIIQELERTVTSLRFIIANLIDEQYEHKTLSELIHSLENRFNRFLLMKVFVYENNPEKSFDLRTNEKHQLMLIVQEAMQNSIKHSNSQQFHIHITWQEDKLVLETEDGSWSIDPAATPGMGLKSMEQRAKSINANFYTAFAIEKGMVVHVGLPRSQNAITQ
jgi:signal transduction histidine kinase